MSRFTPKKATRKGQWGRVALDGPTGSGKTWTALQIARALAGPDGTILLLDTERGSSQLYSDLYDFEVIEWDPPFDPRELRQVMAEFQDQYDVIIVDSGSHFWMGEGGTLDIVDAASSRQFGGNRFAGWQEGTPAQNDLVEAFVTTNAHVIVTMRSKMEYALDEQNRPQKIGMAPVQRDGLEYEFTVVASMDLSHRMTISKSRCDLIADKVYNQGHSEEMALTLKDWLGSAEPMATAGAIGELRSKVMAVTPQETRNDLVRELKTKLGVSTLERLTEPQYDEAMAELTAYFDAMPTGPTETEDETDPAYDGQDVDPGTPYPADQQTTDEQLFGTDDEDPAAKADRIAAEIAAEEEAARA
jgi:hypothetical protein